MSFISKIKEFFISHPDHVSTMQMVNYRTRRNNTVFNGEKQSGGMNYATGYDVDRPTLIMRSKKAYAESTQASAAINRLVDSVINIGLFLEATPHADLLGISPDQKQEISNRIESRFSIYSNDPLKRCDITRNNSISQIERILFYNQLVKGDYFVQLIFFSDPALINPLVIRVIDPARVCNPNDHAMILAAERRGNQIVSGLEIDENGVTVAIFVKYKDKKTGQTAWQRVEVYNPETGRQVIIHGNRQKFGTEVRGVPVLANVCHELEKITDYSLLELMAAVANATVANVVIPSENAPATNPMPANSFVPPNLLKGSNSWQVSNDEQANLDHGITNLGKTVMENSGGLMVASLDAGQDLKSFDTKRPNVNFSSFVDAITKHLSASMNIPIEVLTMTFGNNFSASRASLKLFWQSVLVWRDEMISDFRRPVHSAFLLGEVGTGNLILPGYDNPQLRPAWESANFIGIPSPSIDPVKEAKAAELRTSNAITTREQEQQRAGNMRGYDATVQKLKDENIKLAEAKQPLEE